MAASKLHVELHGHIVFRLCIGLLDQWRSGHNSDVDMQGQIEQSFANSAAEPCASPGFWDSVCFSCDIQTLTKCIATFAIRIPLNDDNNELS